MRTMSPDDLRTVSPWVCTSLGRLFLARLASFWTLMASVLPSLSKLKTTDRLYEPSLLDVEDI